MKKEAIYTQWKVHRRQIQVPEDFAAGVMARIENQAPNEEYDRPAGRTGIRYRMMQWSVAAGLILLGIFRVFYIAANLLRANLIMPY